MIYTVTFNPALDYVMRLDRFSAGEVNRTQEEDVQFGGKGINVSTVLKNLGVENVALGFLAGFTGRALEQGLAAQGVRTDFTWLPAGHTRINVKIKADTETDLNASGPAIGAEAMDELHTKLDALREGDVLVLAGSIPPSLPGTVYEEILARLAGRGVLAVVDATGELLRNVLKYRPFLIKPNQFELGELFGRSLDTDEEIAQAAAELQRQGARNVLVSMAGAGAMLMDETGCTHRIAAPRGVVRNSVGAGDSMVAGFLAGWFSTRRYDEALCMGAAAGSATAFSDGLATREDVQCLLDMMREEK